MESALSPRPFLIYQSTERLIRFSIAFNASPNLESDQKKLIEPALGFAKFFGREVGIEILYR
jgi:hypothetical protein